MDTVGAETDAKAIRKLLKFERDIQRDIRKLQDTLKPVKSLLATTHVPSEIHIQENDVVAILFEKGWYAFRIVFGMDGRDMFLEQQAGSRKDIGVIVNDEDHAVFGC